MSRLYLYLSIDLAINSPSTNKRTFTDVPRFYNFAAQLNVLMDYLVGITGYPKLRLILEPLYGEILNNLAISPNKSAETWADCVKFMVTASAKVFAQALLNAQRDLKLQALIADIEGLANTYKQQKALKRCGSTPVRALSAEAISKLLKVSAPSSLIYLSS